MDMAKEAASGAETDTFARTANMRALHAFICVSNAFSQMTDTISCDTCVATKDMRPVSINHPLIRWRTLGVHGKPAIQENNVANRLRRYPGRLLSCKYSQAHICKSLSLRRAQTCAQSTSQPPALHSDELNSHKHGVCRLAKL